MYKILTLNNISPVGLEHFPRESYEVASEIGHPDAIHRNRYLQFQLSQQLVPFFLCRRMRNPDFTLAHVERVAPIRDPNYRDRFLRDLQRAGLSY